MTLRDEIESYKKAKVSLDTGEIEFWDHVIFPNVIRQRQIMLILNALEQVSPQRILDFGCGAGWLSKILLSKGYNVTGVDASELLIGYARESCNKDLFVVGDCMHLPFGESRFDCITGSAILHHLDAIQALSECYRVTSSGGTLLLMEPNKLNPIAALGRKMTNLQTGGEKPFHPRSLEKALVSTGWSTVDVRYLFPYSFGLSYLFKTLRLGNRQELRAICPFIEASEHVFEKVPLSNRLGYLIFVVARKKTQ